MEARTLNPWEACVRSLPLPAYVCDAAGKIACYNEAAAALWGRDPLDKDDDRFCGSLRLTSATGEPLLKSASPMAVVLQTGSDQRAVMTIHRPDATTERVVLHARPLDDPQGPRGAICVMVPEARHLADAAQPSLAPLDDFQESVIRTASEGICVCFAVEEYPFVYFTVWNDRMTEITGYSREEINRLGWYQTMYPDPGTSLRAQERMQAMRDGHDLRGEEWRITCKDDSERILSISTSLVQRDAAVPAVVALMHDVTERHRSREALRASEERLKLAMDASQLGLWDWNLQTQEVFFSAEWKQQLGYAEDELSSGYEEWSERLHPDDRQRVLQRLNGYLEGSNEDYELEFRLRHRDGSYRWIYTRGAVYRDPQGKPLRMTGCHLDITDRKRTDQTLNRILQSVVSTTGQEYFSRLVQFLGEACGADIVLVAELEPAQTQWATTVALLRDGNIVDNICYDLTATPHARLLEDNQVHHLAADSLHTFPQDPWLHDLGVRSLLGVAVRDNCGMPTGVVVLLSRQRIDDPEHASLLLQVVGARTGAELQRRRAEAEVRTSARTLTKIAETMPNSLYVFNVQTRETEFQNRSVGRDLGYSAAEVESMGADLLGQLLHPDDLAELPKLVARWDEAVDGAIYETEYRMRHKDGQWRHFLGRDTVYERDFAGKVQSIIGTAQDVTQRVHAEQQRRQFDSQVQHLQKLESLGVLAGGIAHDFNNLLTSILGFADLALLGIPEESQAAGHIREVVKGAKSAAELTSQMLAYSGKGNFITEAVSLSSLVQETARLLQVSISKKCALRLHLAEGLPDCQGDVGQLRQVIMNLVINASDAIGEQDGLITVATKTEMVAPGRKETWYPGGELPCGEYVCLEVSDDGCGMDEATCQKLFDPFFTTKVSGRGLGMSVVLGVVRSHGGKISIDTRPEKGTTFRVLLPAVARPVGGKVAVEVPMAQLNFTGTVLVADDEPTVLQSTSNLLERLGFRVLVAADGREALQQFEAHQEEIDLVLLDLTMPRVDGFEACEQIHRISPATPVLLMSGYSEAAQENPPSGPCSFLQKPFRVEELRSQLAQFLRPAGVVQNEA